MKPRLHTLLSLLSGAVVLVAAYLCDRWILAGAARTHANIGDHSFVWAQPLSRLGTALALLALSWLVLRRRPGKIVTVTYLVIGSFLALFEPLAASGAQFIFALPYMDMVIMAGPNLKFSFAFFATLGIAALVRPIFSRDLATPDRARRDLSGAET